MVSSPCACVFILQRQQRYDDSLAKTTRARNDYILALEGTKAALNKYFDHDVSEIISVSIRPENSLSISVHSPISIWQHLCNPIVLRNIKCSVYFCTIEYREDLCLYDIFLVVHAFFIRNLAQ